MKKKEIISKIEEILENVEELQSKIYVEIVEKLNDDTTEMADLLMTADTDIDNCVRHLEQALEHAKEIEEYEYETTYAKMARHITNKILCNRINEIDECINGFIPDRQSNDGKPIGKIMQYYLTDCSSNDVDYLCENYDRVYFSYSEKLDMWVLLVDHWGSQWDTIKIGTHIEYDKID